MKKNIRKQLLQLCIPILTIYLLIGCVALTILNKNDLSASLIFNQPIINLAILGVSLCLNLGSLMIISSKYSEHTSKLNGILERLSVGELDIDLAGIDDATDDLSMAVIAVANNIKAYAVAANDLAEGKTDLEIISRSEDDLLGCV
jgi:hypothetical protein